MRKARQWHLAELGDPPDVRFVPILLKKSPQAHERIFLAPPVRPTLGDVRDPIDSRKNDLRLFVHVLQRLRAAETTKNGHSRE
jgi:hypothetical protein